jgi:hypothetical protein
MKHIRPGQMLAFVDELSEIEKEAQLSAITGAVGRGAGRVGGWLKRFGKRQYYSVTGRGVKDIEEARKLGIVPKIEQMAAKPGMTARQTARAQKKFLKARTSRERQEEAFRAGYLHAPGAIRGLVTHPVKTLRSGWQRGGLMGKGFAGLGAYETGKAALTPTEPGGPGKPERMLRAAGSTVGWLAAPHTLVGGMLMGEGLSAAAGRAGRAISGGRKPLYEAPAPARAGRLAARGLLHAVSPIEGT